jgi:hypothetical protein
VPEQKFTKDNGYECHEVATRMPERLFAWVARPSRALCQSGSDFRRLAEILFLLIDPQISQIAAD